MTSATSAPVATHALASRKESCFLQGMPYDVYSMRCPHMSSTTSYIPYNGGSNAFICKFRVFFSSSAAVLHPTLNHPRIHACLCACLGKDHLLRLGPSGHTCTNQLKGSLSPVLCRILPDISGPTDANTNGTGSVNGAGAIHQRVPASENI